MTRVLEECDHVAADFSADPVHDLRVALRRCRSVADGMIAMDPDPEWKAMKKAGKRLFQRLGALRDIQIMMEWLEKLHPATASAPRASSPAPLDEQEGVSSIPTSLGNPENLQTENLSADDSASRLDPTQVLFEILQSRESEQKSEARSALDDFDRKQWRQWSKTLPLRATRIRPGSIVFKHLALERWTAARDLHNRALRNRSQVAFHTLRIGIKRFRYIVENFLPDEHKAWSKDLKHMQDLLGEVHDLDVLWATALGCHIFPTEEARKNWHARILEERTTRIDEYRKRTIGPESLWTVWRAGLPQGKQIADAATRRMKVWAKVLDPDFAHSERVARFSVALYDDLTASGLLGPRNGSPSTPPPDARASLYIAALLHDVGKSEGNQGHHKASLELIKGHGTPLGWTPENMARAAIVARFHVGALPAPNHKLLRDLLPEEQKITIQLAALLRLANAMDTAHDGQVRRVKIENTASAPRSTKRTDGFLRKSPSLGPNQALVIAAEGFAPESATAQTVAAERYLLETVLRRPVVVKAMPASVSPRVQRRSAVVAPKRLASSQSRATAR